MNPNEAKRLGTYIRKARERAGLSQLALSRAVGKDSNTQILRLERGENLAPGPEFLAAIAKVLGLDVFDVYERAGYTERTDLPTLPVYLRAKYGDLPEDAASAITAYAERLARKHGVELAGPAPGEDETPEPAPNTTKKGGTRHANSRTR